MGRLTPRIADGMENGNDAQPPAGCFSSSISRILKCLNLGSQSYGSSKDALSRSWLDSNVYRGLIRMKRWELSSAVEMGRWPEIGESSKMTHVI